MATAAEYFIDRAKAEVHGAVRDCVASPKDVIARYTAAIAVNFTDWMGKTTPWARHELARYVLVDNLRCESEDDHAGMLTLFAGYCGALPTRAHYDYVGSKVDSIRNLFTDRTRVGLYGVALCAALENTSPFFIPDLARRAKDLGCTDFTYTDVHGEADAKHSRAFMEALEAEMNMGYDDPEGIVTRAVSRAAALIHRIYS